MIRIAVVVVLLSTLVLTIYSGSLSIDYSGPTDDWPAYGSRPGGGHYSRATQITPENVHTLKKVWSFQVPDHRKPGDETVTTPEGEIPSPPSGLQVTPILFNEVLYMCTSFNRIFALNPATGEPIWNYDAGVDSTKEVLTNCRGVSSWQSETETGACSSRIIFGTLHGKLISLDAKDGKPCAGFGENGIVDLEKGLGDHHPYEHSVTSPPAILNNKIIVGSNIIDSAYTKVPSGVVRAFDLITGEMLWYWDPIPPGREPILDHSEGQMFERGTTNVWSIISVDTERNLVFLPTGNTDTDYYGGHRSEDFDYYSSSVVALNGDTGKVVWNFQMVHHDVWDYDTPSQPTLFEFKRDGELIPALAQPTKMGHLFYLNRETGEPLFPVEERPVPQEGKVPGEYLAPTQPFPTKPAPLHPHGLKGEELFKLHPWDTSCEDKYASIRDEGIFTPLSLEGTLMYPSPLGGQNWGSPAIDEGRDTIIVNQNRLPQIVTLVPAAECEKMDRREIWRPQKGSGYCVKNQPFFSSVGAPCNGFPVGTLISIDLVTGDKNWEVPLGTFAGMVPIVGRFFKGSVTIGGPITTASGLIFIASTVDSQIWAFDTETGEELWKGKLPEIGAATPMTYRVGPDDKQYVVVAAGGHWGFGPAETAQLVAFALPD